MHFGCPNTNWKFKAISKLLNSSDWTQEALKYYLPLLFEMPRSTRGKLCPQRCPADRPCLTSAVLSPKHFRSSCSKAFPGETQRRSLCMMSRPIEACVDTDLPACEGSPVACEGRGHSMQTPLTLSCAADLSSWKHDSPRAYQLSAQCSTLQKNLLFEGWTMRQNRIITVYWSHWVRLLTLDCEGQALLAARATNQKTVTLSEE